MYIDISLYILYVHIYTYIDIHDMHICTYTHTCVDMYEEIMHMCRCKYVYIYVRICMYVHVCVRVSKYVGMSV